MAQGSDRDIRQRITLEGGEEIKRQLADMGKVGEKAIAEIDRAVNSANAPVGKLQGAIENLRARFSGIRESVAPAREAIGGLHERITGLHEATRNFAEHTIPGFREAIAIVGVGSLIGFVAIAKQAADRLHEIELRSRELGVSLSEYKKLVNSAATFGLDEEEFATGFSKLTKRVQEEVDKQRGAAISVAQIVAGAMQAGPVAVLNGLNNASEKLRGKVLDVGGAFNPGLNDAIKTAYAEMVKANATGGLSFDAFAAKARGMLMGNAAGADELRKKLLELNVALPKELVSERLQKEMPGFLSVLQRMNIALRDTQGNVRRPFDIFGDFLDAFAKLPNISEQTKVAIEVFGRGGSAFIPMMQQGRKALEAYAAQWKVLGVEVPEANQHVLEAQAATATKFRMQTIMLEAAINKIKNSVGLAIGTAFGPIIERITILLTTNSAAITGWVSNISKSVAQVVQDLLNVLSGTPVELQNGWIRQLVPLFDDIVQGATTAGQAVVAAFNSISDIVQTVANGINQAFGTEFTGRGLVIAAILLQLTGAFGLLNAAVSAFVIGPAVALAGLIGVGGALIVGLLLLGGYLLILNDNWRNMVGVVQGASKILAALADKLGPFGNTLKIVSLILAGDFAGAFDALIAPIRTVLEWIEYLIEGFERLLGLKKQLNEMPEPTVGAGGGPGNSDIAFPGAAVYERGGDVRGPRGTDNVPIWATAGEFMMKVAAVRHYGLGFMQRINSMQVPRFNLGGVIPSFSPSAPYYARGGPVLGTLGAGAGGTPVHIHMPNGNEYALSGTASVASRLAQESTTYQTRRAGLMPSWRSGLAGG